MSGEPMRVISLLSAATEIICALGRGDTLVGRSHECDNPPWVSTLPSLTQPTFDTSMRSALIDEEVRRRLKTNLPLYHLNYVLMEDLKPDIIITQAHCQVCALTDTDLSDSSACPIPTVVLHAGTLAGITGDIGAIAAALGCAVAGESFIAQDQHRRDTLALSIPAGPRPSVLLLEWVDPLFAIGNWGPEVIAHAGGNAVLGSTGRHSQAISWNAVLETDPEIIVIAPCGFDIERTRGEAGVLRRHDGWQNLRAVKTGHVYLADGNRYFNRSGITITDSMEILTEIFWKPTRRYPDAAWARWIP